MVFWKKPAGGDAIDEYVVTWNASSLDNSFVVYHEPGKNEYESKINQLVPGQYYSVFVTTQNSEGKSDSFAIAQNTCE